MAAPARGDTRVDAYVGLGSNLGDRAGAIERALAGLAALPETSLVARSALYRSAPLDAPGDDYLNAVAHLRTALAPLPCFNGLQRRMRRRRVFRQRAAHARPRRPSLR
jgi:2-amino-4-hydroxy-6-hydroxymethyldihydropteridine diphosphokinase